MKERKKEKKLTIYQNIDKKSYLCIIGNILQIKKESRYSETELKL